MSSFYNIEKNLINIQKPARYIGNEIGIPDKNFEKSNVRFVICYPDVYEIGMSNLGIQIIYDRINNLDFASCERVFSPWVDFEKFLKDNDIDLFSLETKTPIKNFDILGISIQYELLFTNFLNILSLSKIEILREKRDHNTPIILLGGPAITNPFPYMPFADLFLIGEAEEVLEKILYEYNNLKNKKITKLEILKYLSEKFDCLYSPFFPKQKVIKSVYYNFIFDSGIKNYLIPHIDIVQNKLSIEIMRGCPNKCRFCHAGYLYKPSREKKIDNIIYNIYYGLNKLGISEVTLSSLSSGDYSDIQQLTDLFNLLYQEKKISFSFPSLKVESFDLELIDKLSLIRKSGLTFAIESGSINGQYSINKIADIEKIKKIISYAYQKGWKIIKLYFMIGLPDQDNEVENIINFIDSIKQFNNKIIIHLNLATFVPKPHTPYQYEKQLSLEESINIFNYFEKYYYNTKVKIKKHSPYMSFIEGLIARGDEKIGYIMYEAYKKGARFDSWDDQFNFQIYEKILKENNINYESYLSKKMQNIALKWDIIYNGFTNDYFIQEKLKSEKKILTPSCKIKCDKNCEYNYYCNKNIEINKNININVYNSEQELPYIENTQTKYLLEFCKLNLMKYISHIDIIKYFERIFNRSRIKIKFSEGFNPHPKFQFSLPLTVGIESNCEILEFTTLYYYDLMLLFNELKKFEHKDLKINRIKLSNNKKISIINNIKLIIYRLLFDKNEINNIINIVNFYNNNIITDNNIKLNDYIKILNNINNNNSEIFIEEKIENNKPKLINSIKKIFNNIEFKIIKEKMLTDYNNNYIDLFDIFDKL